MSYSPVVGFLLVITFFVMYAGMVAGAGDWRKALRFARFWLLVLLAKAGLAVVIWLMISPFTG